MGANVIHLEKNSDNSNLTGSIIKFNSEPIPEKLSEEVKRRFMKKILLDIVFLLMEKSLIRKEDLDRKKKKKPAKKIIMIIENADYLLIKGQNLSTSN